MGRKLLKTVQTITTFRNPLADPMGTVADPLWSADPSLKTAGVHYLTKLQSLKKKNIEAINLLQVTTVCAF